MFGTNRLRVGTKLLKKNALFNQKTIERLCSKTKISPKQRKAAYKWIEKLDSDSLRGERKHYLEFRDHILRDLLGYDESEIKFEEENVEFSVNDQTGKRTICFEVKGTGTKDLFAKQARDKREHETPVKQLWDYMNQDGTPFGITTNYRVFLLFDHSKGQSNYHKLDFLDIKKNDQKLREFVSIFSRKSIIEDRFVEKLHDESVIEEREFTKEFYKLFHETRLMLIEEFKTNEELRDKVKTPLHFAQLYLNRLMFIFFSEDTGKLPHRIFESRVLEILKSKALISDHSRYVSDTIRNLFESVDKGATTPDKIFGFNGGLFKAPIPREKIYFKDLRGKDFFKNIYQDSQLKKEIELDEVSKEILSQYEGKLNPIIKNLLLMVSFDFNSEVNVNILGHIFEQSISDIEELQQEGVSRRKKEGVYYTPEYITDYICRNTIIPYLSKKNAATPRELVLEYTNEIEELERKFSDIKILDPACGSGAFLIKAVDVLLEIHTEVQLFKQDKGGYTAIKKGLKVKKDLGQLVLKKWYEEDEARKIIENNIFGVDINEESVEITKLSLFLKIARENKKLIDLSKNIKRGNSLIDDKEIAGSNAFNWEENFGDIFNGGGFDVIVGNPPYVNIINIPKEDIPYLKKNYSAAEYGRIDLYLIFIQKAIRLLKKGGFTSFIIPDKFCTHKYGSILRNFILDTCQIESILDLRGKRVFEDAAVENIVYVFRREGRQEERDENIIKILKPKKDDHPVLEMPCHKIKQNIFKTIPEYMFRIDLTNDYLPIVKKIQNSSQELKKICYVSFGMQPGKLSKFVFNMKTNPERLKENPNVAKKFIRGRNIERYYLNYGDDILFYLPDELHRPAFPELFENEKISISEISKDIKSTFDDKKYYGNEKTVQVVKWRVLEQLDEKTVRGRNIKLTNEKLIQSDNYNLKFLLCILNSKLIDFYFKIMISDGLNVFPDNIRKLPIVKTSPKKQQKLINKANEMLILTEEFFSNKYKFLRLLKANFSINKPTKKLDSFYQLTFEEFKGELERLSKTKLSYRQQDELIDVFDKYKEELLELQKKIVDTDNEIDEMVFDLYGLKEEKDIIRNN